MAIYFITFPLSIYFMWKAFYNEQHELGHIKRWIVLSLVVIAVLAALRGTTVGTDTSGYQTRLFRIAQNYHSIAGFVAVSNQEPLYASLTYIISKLGQMPLVHLANILIVLVPIYKVVWEVRYDVSPELSLACFLSFYYGWALNGIRQSIAMSICILAVYLLSKHKIVGAILLSVIAIGFHYSAVIGFVILLLYYTTVSECRNIYKVIVAISLAAVVILYRQLIDIAISLFRFFKSNYSSDRALGSGSFDTNVTMVILCLLAVFTLVVTQNVKNYSYLNIDFLNIITAILVASIFIGGGLGYANRIFKYFDRYIIFILPRLGYAVKMDERNQIIWKIGFYIFLVLYWVYAHAYRGWNDIVPYVPYWVK